MNCCDYICELMFSFYNQGLSCICDKNSRIVNKVLEFSSCEPCPPNTTLTLDHMHCLKKTNLTCGSKDIECMLYLQLYYVLTWENCDKITT